MGLTGLIIQLLNKQVTKGFIKPAFSDSDLRFPLANPEQGFNPTQYLVPLDLLYVESYDKSSTPTKSQVEDGATISDHVTPSPDKLNIEAMVSDTPVSIINAIKGSFMSKPSQDAFSRLEALADSRQPFTFVGGLKVYRSMVLTKFIPMKNAKTGSALKFSATLEKVVIVQTETVQNISKKHQQQFGKRKDNGTQLAQTPSLSPSTFQNVEKTAQTQLPLLSKKVPDIPYLPLDQDGNVIGGAGGNF